jgi:DNA-binding YbaB/EbfC family protein
MSGFGDMGNLLKQAQEMQRNLDRARAELKDEVVEGRGGGGAVRVEVNGDGEVRAVHIDDEVVGAGDRAMLEDLVLAALRDGISRSMALRREKLGAVTGGLDLPGLF